MAQRILGPEGSKRRWRFRNLSIPVVLAIALALFLAGGAQAVHDLNFQLDGDTVATPVTNVGGHAQNFDWNSFFDTSGTPSPALPDASRPGFTASTFVRDFRTNPGCSLTGTGSYCTADSSTFTTGSKDTLDITPGWQCTYSNNVNSKTDLSNVYAAAYTDPTSGHKIIYFALERNDNSGDGNVAFWFLQDGSVGCNASTSGVNVPFTGHHTNGDILVVSAFTNGGTVSNITAYAWNNGALGTAPIAQGGDCKNSTGLDATCATVNVPTITVPWLTANKQDGVQHNLRESEFFEGGLDLTASHLANTCFSSFLGDTRSSQSLTATIFDYAGGSFQHCGANISIAPSAVNEVGTAHQFTVHITQSNAGVSAPAPVGTKATVTLTDQNNNTVTATTDNCATTGTDANGNCTVVVNSSTAKVITAHATASVVIQGQTFNVSTNGTGGNSGDAVKRYVDANVSISPNGVNEVGNQHTFTISTTALPSGTTPSLTSITPSVTAPAGFVLGTDYTTSNTCASPTGSGAGPRTCTVTVNSSKAGTFTAHAVAVWHFLDTDTGASPSTVDVTRATDGSHGSSQDATKRFVDANVSITPSAVNAVGSPHVFTISTTALPSGTTASLTSLTPSITAPAGFVLGTDYTLTNNTCSSPTGSGAGPRTCSITLTSSKAGVFTANATAVWHFTDGTNTADVTRTTDNTHGSTGPATKRFVDAKISLSPLTAVNEVNHAHTITATVQQNDGLPAGAPGDGVTGFGPAPDGTVVTFSLSNNSAGATFVSGNSCTINNGLGTCSIQINSTSAGSVTIDATTTFSVGGVSLTRATGDGLSGDGSSVSKRFVDANISITPLSATNEVNHPHVFTITSIASPAGTNPVLDYIHFTLSSVPSTESDSCGTPTVNGNTAICTVTITSSSAGTFTINAEAKWTFNDSDPGANPASVDVVRSTQGNSGPGGGGPATKRFVDAYITITPAEATNSVGQAHTDTVNVFVDNGNHAPGVPVWEPAPNGTIVHVTLTPDPSDPGAVPVVIPPGDVCGTLGTSNGACTITFTSTTAGTIIAHASTDVLAGGAGGLLLHRETDGINPNSGNAIKHFRAGAIAWTKQDDAGRPLGGATFQLCQISTYDVGTGNFDPITPICQSVTDNQPPDEDGAAGGFKVSGLQLGQYTVHETQAPPGYDLDPSTKQAALTPQNSGTVQVIQAPFVDTRPDVKITGFGYTNAPTAGVSQPDGIFAGTTTFTVSLHNYGTSTAHLTASSLAVSNNATCNPSNTKDLSGIDIPAGADGPAISLQCTYDHPSPTLITATLTVNYLTNGFTYHASGSPATISFTVDPNHP